MARSRRSRPLPDASRERRPLISRYAPQTIRGAVRRIRGWTALALLALSQARGAQAQDSIPGRLQPDSAPQVNLQHDSVAPLIVRADPLLLTEGTIAWLRIRARDGLTVAEGRAATEPIHFERSAAGEYRALVGVPIGAGDSLGVSIYLASKERTDTVTMAIPVRRGDFPREQIAVAPAFVKPNKVAAARIRAELVKSREVSRKSHEKPRLWRGTFHLPRPSRITSTFGSARVYNGEVKSRHLGTDFAGAVGTPVRAAARGVVALIGNFYLAGRAVYIDHGGGLVTTYFHLSRVNVRVGETVVAGQRIGRVGQSGRVTGPHLHWAARYGKIAVDPMSLLTLE